jgi:hypothetical protein
VQLVSTVSVTVNQLPQYMKCGLWVVAALAFYIRVGLWLKRVNIISLVTADVRSLCLMAGTIGMYSDCA